MGNGPAAVSCPVSGSYPYESEGRPDVPKSDAWSWSLRDIHPRHGRISWVHWWVGITTSKDHESVGSCSADREDRPRWLLRGLLTCYGVVDRRPRITAAAVIE